MSTGTRALREDDCRNSDLRPLGRQRAVYTIDSRGDGLTREGVCMEARLRRKTVARMR
jgi:hypothetical protein